MRVAVTGAGGLIGAALTGALTSAGHEVLRLVRRSPTSSAEVRWDPATGRVDRSRLAGLDAVIHLAGAGVGEHRWTPAYKQVIRDSRVLGTTTLVETLSALDEPPRVLLSASAIGYYGSRGEEELDEDSAPGTGFLAEVVQAWEAAAEPAEAAGIRVTTARTGLVMSRRGGAFGRLLPLVRAGLGGPLGSGRQWWSWITLEDEVAALTFLLEHDVRGAVNLVAPAPARQVDVVRALGRAMRRPTLLPAPAAALRLVLGEFADDVLASQRVRPSRLHAAGFGFRQPDLDAAAAWTVSRG